MNSLSLSTTVESATVAGAVAVDGFDGWSLQDLMSGSQIAAMVGSSLPGAAFGSAEECEASIVAQIAEIQAELASRYGATLEARIARLDADMAV